MANRRGKLSILIEAKNLAGKAFLQVKSQARDASQSVSTGFGKAREGLAKFGTAMRGLVLGFATFAALRIGRELFAIGSAAVETASKFGTTFGPELERMNEFLEENAARMGASRAEMQNMLATTAAMVQGIGATIEESAAFSEQITILSADLASFNNVAGGAEDVSQRVTKALLGERESLKQLGIAVQESEVQERALQLTRKRSIGEVTALEKAEATLAIITEKAAVAVGDLDRTQNSAANRARRLSAEFRTLRETIAVAVLPVFDRLLEVVDSVDFVRFAAALETDVGEAFRNLGIVIGARLGQGIFTGLETVFRETNVLARIPGIGGLFDRINVAAFGAGKIADIARDSAEQAGEAIGILANASGSLQNVTAAIQAARDRLSGGSIDTGTDTTDDDAAAKRLKELTDAGKATANALEAVQAKASLLGDSFDAPAERARILKSAVEAFTEAGLEANDVIPGLGITLGQLAFEYQSLSGEIAGAESRQKAFADAQDFLAGLLRQTETEADRYAQTVARLNALFGAGLITQAQFSDGLEAARKAFDGGASELEERARILSENVSRGVQEAMTSGLTDLGESVGELLAGTGDQMASLGDVVTATLGGLMKTVGQSLIAFGTAGVAIKKFIANPFAAIAAGVALVALGSALTSSVQASVSSAGASLAGGGSGAGGATPTAGASIDRDLAGRQGDVTLIIEGGDLLDTSNPKTERALRDALEELSGRRVTTVVRRRT